MSERLPIKVIYHTRLDNQKLIYLANDTVKVMLPLTGQTNAFLLHIATQLADLFGTKVTMTKDVVIKITEDPIDESYRQSQEEENG